MNIKMYILYYSSTKYIYNILFFFYHGKNRFENENERQQLHIYKIKCKSK